MRLCEKSGDRRHTALASRSDKVYRSLLSGMAALARDERAGRGWRWLGGDQQADTHEDRGDDVEQDIVAHIRHQLGQILGIAVDAYDGDHRQGKDQ